MNRSLHLAWVKSDASGCGRSGRAGGVFGGAICVLAGAFTLTVLMCELGGETAYAKPHAHKAAPHAKAPRAGAGRANTSEQGDEEGPSKSAAGQSCKATLLIEAKSGDVLAETNAHTPLAPASMVKMMVAYTTMKKIKAGVVKPTDIVTTSAFASKVGGSQVYLKQGEQFTIEQLLEAVLIQSANDAAVAIAEHIGGTEEGFVEMMNQEAKELGMKESEFHSAHGLPPGKDQKPDLVSASDFGLLARAILRDFPETLKYTGTQKKDFRDGAFVMTNHNHLLREYPGCDGIKTGYYNEAGFCVTATATRNDMRMIAVLMGCPGRKERDKEASRLLSLGFAQYTAVKLIEKGAPASQPVVVANGEKASVIPVAKEAALGIVRRGDEQKVERRPKLCAGVNAPVQPNTPCGSISFVIGEREVGKVDMVIPEAVGTVGTMGKLRKILHL